MKNLFPLLAPAALLTSLLLSARPAAAQGWVGLTHSNYAGTSAAYVNPSALADSRHGFYLQVVAADVSFDNTYLQLALPGAPWKSGFEFKQEYFRERLDGRPKVARLAAEVRLPSFLLTLGPRSALAFTSRARALVQADNVSEELARLIRFGLADAPRLGLAGKVLTDNRFNVNASSYQEFALSFARALTPNQTHFFKVGASVKYLVGLGGGYVRNAGVSYRVLDARTLQINTPGVDYAYTDNQFYKQKGFGAGTLLGGERLGQGFGADLGLTYEWRPEAARFVYQAKDGERPDPTVNKYRLRLGLALTDVGSIRYDNTRYVSQAAFDASRVVTLRQVDTITFNPLARFGNTAQRLIGLRDQARAFSSALPTALRLTADYRLAPRLYAGLLWQQNLLGSRATGPRTPSLLALTPRLELCQVEVALPVLLANDYRDLQIGAMLRLGPLVLGSDNLAGLFGLTTTTGADAYFGLALALGRHRRGEVGATGGKPRKMKVKVKPGAAPGVVPGAVPVPTP